MIAQTVSAASSSSSPVRSAPVAPAHGAAPAGPESWKAAVTLWRSSFPDLRYTIEDLFAAHDKVAVRWTAHGTDTVGFMGRRPTGRSATVTGMTIYRLAGGQLIEHWDEFDLVGLLQALGHLPPG